MYVLNAVSPFFTPSFAFVGFLIDKVEESV